MQIEESMTPLGEQVSFYYFILCPMIGCVVGIQIAKKTVLPVWMEVLIVLGGLLVGLMMSILGALFVKWVRGKPKSRSKTKD
jgi:hypothetical protein